MVIKQAERARKAAHCSHTARAHTYTAIWVNITSLTLPIFPAITPTVKQIGLKAVANIFSFLPPAKQNNFWT